MRIPSDKKNAPTARPIPSAVRRGLWVLLPALLTGCAGFSASKDYKPYDDRLAGIQTDLAELERVKAAVPAHIGLEDAIRYALDNNLELAMARWEIEAASEAHAASELKLLPNLDVNARYEERSEYMTRSLYNTETGQIVPSTVVSDGKTTETANLAVTWRVLDSMVNYVGAQQAEREVEKKKLAREKLRTKIALDVTEAFWKAAADEDMMIYLREAKRAQQDALYAMKRSLIDSMSAEIKAKGKRGDAAMRREVDRLQYDLKKQDYDQIKLAADLRDKAAAQTPGLRAELQELQTWRQDMGKGGQPEDPAFRRDLDQKIDMVSRKLSAIEQSERDNAAVVRQLEASKGPLSKQKADLDEIKERVKAQLHNELAGAEGNRDQKRALLKELEQLESGYACSSLTSGFKAEKLGVTSLQLTDGCKKLADIEVTIQMTQERLASARLKLVNLMGMTQRGEFELRRRDMVDVVAGLPRPRDFRIETLECMALRNQPDLYAQDITIRQHQDEGRKAMLRMFPGINLFAGEYYDGNNLLENNVWSSIGASLSWNLFALPAQYRDMKSKEMEEARQRVKRILITSSAITGAHVSLLDYNNKADRFRLLDDSYGLASKAYNLSEELKSVNLLDGGDSTPAMRLAERKLEEVATKVRRDEAVVDTLVAYSQLLSTAGVPPEHWTKRLDEIGLAGAQAGEKLMVNFPVGQETMPGKDCGSLVDASPVVARSTTPDPQYQKQQTAAIARAIDTPTRSAPATASEEWAKNSLWSVQVGAFERSNGPAKRLDEISSIGTRLVDPRDAKTSTTTKAGRELKRVRFYGFSREEATRFVDELRSKGMEYWLVPPYSKYN